jgi:hypothetical protein
MPARQRREALLTDRPAAVLLLPPTKQRPSALQLVCHPSAQPGCTGRFPRRSRRLGRALDVGGPTPRHPGGADQAHVLLGPMGTRDVPKAPPVIPGCDSTGLVPPPRARGARGAPPRPLPPPGQALLVSVRTGPRAGPRLVRLRPAPQHRRHRPAHVARAGVLVTLHAPADGVQDAPHGLLGWRTAERPARRAPAGAQQGKPRLPGRDPRLRSRACQASCRETRGHTGVDGLGQEACGVARDAAIIRHPAHVAFRPGCALAGRQGAWAVPRSTGEGQGPDARRHHAPWRSARCWWREDGLSHAARWPPWPPDGGVQGARRSPPVVRHAGHAGPAVALAPPLGRRSQRPHPMARIAGGGRRSL